MLELARRSRGDDEVRPSNRTHEYLAALEQKVLWLACWTIHHANHVRAKPRRPQGRRPSGVLRLDRDADDGALLRRAAPGRPGRGQAARQPGLPRDPVPARPADAGQARALPRARRRAGLPVAHQGRRRRRLLDRLGRARRGDHPVRLAHAGPAARAPAAAGGSAQRAHDRAGRRRRARRGQRVRGAARGLEARHPQRLVGDRLQPPEPRSRSCPSACSPRSRTSSARSAGRSSRSSTASCSRRRSASPMALRYGSGSTTARTTSTRR